MYHVLFFCITVFITEYIPITPPNIDRKRGGYNARNAINRSFDVLYFQNDHLCFDALI